MEHHFPPRNTRDELFVYFVCFVVLNKVKRRGGECIRLRHRNKAQ